MQWSTAPLSRCYIGASSSNYCHAVPALVRSTAFQLDARNVCHVRWTLVICRWLWRPSSCWDESADRPLTSVQPVQSDWTPYWSNHRRRRRATYQHQQVPAERRPQVPCVWHAMIASHWWLAGYASHYRRST